LKDIKRDRDNRENQLSEKVIRINRVSKTVKGGRTMSFSAFGAVGDGKGAVGIGLGKAKNPKDAVKKSLANAKKGMASVSLKGSTIPHQVIGICGATKVFMKPAPEGTGLVAGSAAREILEVAGVANVFSKVMGSKNKVNVARATIEGLGRLRTFEEVMTLRGKK